MPRINLTIEEHEAIRPVLEAHRQAAALRAERIRTLLAVRQAMETAINGSIYLSRDEILDVLSNVESSL